jgi:phosphoribosylanthranilate isomerase
MWVKICGITNEEDALAAVALGADAVGFVFAPSTRQVTVGTARDIARRLPPEVMTVGVFRDQSPDFVIDTVLEAGLRGAQLHGHETPSMAAEIRPKVQILIVAFAAGDAGIARYDDFGADALLIDGTTPGSGRVFDWTMVDSAPDNRRVIVAGGLTPDNVADAVALTEPWGVDVSTGVESSPGQKDPRLVQAFIHASRSVDLRAPERRPVSSSPGPFDWNESGDV